MSYKIQHTLPLNEEIKRVVNERLEDSVQHLDNYGQNPDEAVHEVRKNMKKTRAVLRLARYSYPDDRYKKLNAFYRDTSKRFAALREAKVHRETIHHLKEDNNDLPPLADIVENIINNYYQHAAEQMSRHENILTEVSSQLKDSKKDIEDLPLESTHFDLVYNGLKKIYKQGRDAFSDVKKVPDAEHFHEFRKRVKYLWYHLRLLRNAWPVVLKGYNKSLDKLSDFLGEEHDLAELKHLILDSGQLKTVSENEKKELIQIIEAKRKDIQAHIYPAGEKLYYEKPKRFTNRIAHYWRVENEVN